MIDRLIIVGAGGFARELATLLEVNNLAYVHKLRYFVNQEYLGPMTEGIVYRSMYRGSAISEPDLREMDESHVPDVIFGVGDPNVREKMVNFMKGYLPSKRFVSHYIKDKSTFIGHNVEAGEGFIGCQNTVFTCDIKIGEHCHFNLNSTVGHGTLIGDFVTVSPGAKISGDVTLGNNVYIGSNAVIKEGVKVCDNVTIGACAFVNKHITEPGTYVGVPAKRLTR